MLFDKILCSLFFKFSGNFQRFINFFIFTKIVIHERSNFLDMQKLKPVKIFVHNNLWTEKISSKDTYLFKIISLNLKWWSSEPYFWFIYIFWGVGLLIITDKLSEGKTQQISKSDCISLMPRCMNEWFIQ